jgi:F0F1-type ATP synthase membrane subunit b/b'
MNDREDDNLPAEDSISDEISERVRSVLAAAESAATAIRHEAEQQVQLKMRAADAERARLLEDARSEAEALLQERIKRISELSDSLIEGAETILMRLASAEEAKRQLDTMVRALAQTAADLAAESRHGRTSPEATPEPPVMEAAPEPEVAQPEPDPAPRVRVVPDPVEEPAKAELKPVEAVPDEDEDIEVVDAVEVVEDEPEPEPEPEKPSPVERLRKAAAARGENGAKDEATAAAEPEQRGFDGDDMLAARLVALQMAVAGSARNEVEAHLRKTFSLDEPGAILNDVFGAESKL